MKHIRKGRQPREFSDWKQQANSEWMPTYDALAGVSRESVVQALLREQGNICCYCMRRVTANDSHVEHLRPQEHYAHLALDYGNLLLSCQGDHDKSPPLHCGHHKGNRPAPNSEDENLFISPLGSGCERHFRYTGSGEILPLDEFDHAGKRTIEILNTNNNLLINQRRRALDAAIRPVDTSDFDAVEREIDIYMRRNSVGMFAPFCVGIVYLLKWCKEH